MNVGKYNLEKMNDGKWVIQWTDLSTRHRQTLIVSNLESMLDEMVRPYQDHISDFVQIFHNAWINQEDFFKHPLAQTIVDRLPTVKEVPGHLKDYARYIWHLNQFLDAYAACTGIRLKPDDVEPYLLDVRDAIWSHK